MESLEEMYTSEFYDSIRGGSSDSSTVMAPLIVELLQPESVVDVGCGDGTWLSAFLRSGVNTVLGLDGDYVQPSTLQIAREFFVSCDLGNPAALPKPDRRFDLVMTLEVAEHLPPEAAASFVKFLTELGPVVLFSAAIPGQGGSNHLNEQWPDYWAAHFARHGFVPVDCIRHRIWDNSAVKYWYRQNCLLFVNSVHLEASASLQSIAEKSPPGAMSLVHPELYGLVHGSMTYHSQPPSVVKALGSVAPALARAVHRRVSPKSGSQG